MSDLAEELLKLGEERGEKKGEAKGEAKGEQKAKTEIALKLLKMGDLTPEQIAEATGLPLETVLSLKQ